MDHMDHLGPYRGARGTGERRETFPNQNLRKERDECLRASICRVKRFLDVLREQNVSLQTFCKVIVVSQETFFFKASLRREKRNDDQSLS